LTSSLIAELRLTETDKQSEGLTLLQSTTKTQLIDKMIHQLNFNFSLKKEPLSIHVLIGCTVQGCLQLLQIV